MVYAGIGLLIFQYNLLYKIDVVLSIADHFVRLLTSICYMFIGVAVLSFVTKSQLITDSRLVMLNFILLSTGLLIFFRLIIFRNILKTLGRTQIYTRPIVILGANRIGKLLAATLWLNNPYGIRILGFLDDDNDIGTPIFGGKRVLGRINEIVDFARKTAIDEILVCVEKATSNELFDILDRCRQTGAQVKIASPIYDIVPALTVPERYGDIPIVGTIQENRGALQEIKKRMFDVILSSLGMIVLSPLFLLIGFLVKLDSRGPIFYRQVRIGKHGKHFMFYKFRSMVVGSDCDETRARKVKQLIQNEFQSDNGSLKIVDESKITRIGRFIRKTSIDELPQLFNVLKGDMSLVGPRPCLPYEWESYKEWHKKRLNITPGCTGVWQVSGRSAVGFDDMVILDLYYIQNASLFLDLQLILRTVPVMIFGKGAK